MGYIAFGVIAITLGLCVTGFYKWIGLFDHIKTN